MVTVLHHPRTWIPWKPLHANFWTQLCQSTCNRREKWVPNGPSLGIPALGKPRQEDCHTFEASPWERKGEKTGRGRTATSGVVHTLVSLPVG